MANQIVEIAGITTGQALTAKLLAQGSDVIVDSALDLTELTNKKTHYRFTTVEPISGWHDLVVSDADGPIGSWAVNLTNTSSVHYATDDAAVEAKTGALPSDPADNSDIIDAINALAPLIGPVVTPTATEILPADIASLALSPRKIVTDEGSVEERSAEELIKADQYVKAQEIGDLPLHGLRISKFKPAGAV